MKKVIVFGATGRTGRYIVQYALEAGHEVTAFARNNKSVVKHPGLSVVEGNALDEQAVLNSIKGNEVVISALGTDQLEGDAVNMMSEAMKIFIRAMKENNILRVLAVGGLGVLQFNETMQLLDKPDYSPKYKAIGEGHNKVYQVLRQSQMDWTYVCCPDIVAAVKTERYRVNKDYPAEGLFKINTGDLANFIVKEMVEDKFLKTRVGICNY
ncbi:MAG: SDR family oxidoreductase [Bacteroidetes bacterium]|nr:SDR family oxidoreductase [Bacteroidota bacterium]